MAAARLEDLRPEDRCTHRAVVEYLSAQGSRVECVVSVDGTVFGVEGAMPRRVRRALLHLVERHCGSAEYVEVSPIAMSNWRGGSRPRAGDEQAAANAAATAQVEYVLGRAVDAGASDVYLDIRRTLARIAFRVFGFVRPFEEELSAEEGLRLARSIWNLGGQSSAFDPTGACDVSFAFEHGGRSYRVRGNSMKEVRGNSVVCRIRDPSFVLPLVESGYSPVQVRQIERMCRAPGGLILITGETNSGKSTTLSSLIASSPRTERIIEVADPVEVEFDHVSHVEIEHYGEAAERSLAGILAALVRQNPDTLVLGEIRDARSARCAEEMAIQGKRVLSTLHTQSCAAAVPRLVNLGVSPSLVGTRAFLAGVVNQNLVPMVCSSCGLERHPDARTDAAWRERFGGGVRFINPAGCGSCKGGVSGQTLVAEVYPLCLDRSGRAHALIGEGRLADLERYMRDKGPGGGCQSKHGHAAAKIRTGAVDPVETERIIGEFDDAEVVRSNGDLVALRG